MEAPLARQIVGRASAQYDQIQPSFAYLVSPEGPWNKVWLAAHWDKKLKKEDYHTIRIKESIKDYLKNRDSLTLRSMGHLLLGLCKVHSKQCALHEERATEVHDSMMLAFTNKELEPRRKGARAATAEAKAAALEVTEEGLLIDDELEKILSSRKHLAPLEEITLKTPAEFQLVPSPLAGIPNDTFGAITDADSRNMRKLGINVRQMYFPESKFLPLEAPDTLAPLEDISGAEIQSELAMVGDADLQGPLDMDLEPPVLEDANVDMGGPVPLEGGEAPVAETALVSGGGGDEPAIKRRRKGFQFDDPVEIPREVYQGFINDRSAITKKEEYNTSILMPHNHPIMPQFSTTYTDICKSLLQTVAMGTEVAERDRANMAMAEDAAGVGPVSSFQSMVPEVPGFPYSDLTFPSDLTPAQAMPSTPSGMSTWETSTAGLDLSDAPSHMKAVITGSMDHEDQAGNADARVGYSGRTEKMHKFLAAQFGGREAGQKDRISYEQMCRAQSGGDRGVIAGCFFELLVLRTNGVVNLRQERPFADIQIEKAKP